MWQAGKLGYNIMDLCIVRICGALLSWIGSATIIRHYLHKVRNSDEFYGYCPDHKFVNYSVTVDNAKGTANNFVPFAPILLESVD